MNHPNCPGYHEGYNISDREMDSLKKLAKLTVHMSEDDIREMFKLAVMSRGARHFWMFGVKLAAIITSFAFIVVKAQEILEWIRGGK